VTIEEVCLVQFFGSVAPLDQILFYRCITGQQVSCMLIEDSKHSWILQLLPLASSTIFPNTSFSVLEGHLSFSNQCKGLIPLETPKALQRQVREGGFCSFLTLARLLEAYGSQFTPPGTVYLASRKILQREHCSGIARLRQIRVAS
jgi:hypothetical protein